MKFADVKDLSSTELVKRINLKKNELFELKMKSHMGQLANPVQVRTSRRELAQMLTAVNQKAQESNTAEEA
ncbi:MAG: 50S ribosomal protein L29 [Bdellovibrionales bacterium]